MKWYYRVLIVLLLVPMQTLILEMGRVAGVKPDLGLVLAFVWGWIGGRFSGLLYGSALGAMLDLFSVGVPGLNLVLEGVAGLSAGILGHMFVNMAFWIKPVVLCGFSILHDFSGAAWLWGDDMFRVPQHDVFARAIYNSLLGACLLWVWQTDRYMGETRGEIREKVRIYMQKE